MREQTLQTVLTTLDLPLADTRAAMSFAQVGGGKWNPDDQITPGVAGLLAVWRRLRDLKMRDQEQYAILKHFGAHIIQHIDMRYGSNIIGDYLTLQILDNRLVGLSKGRDGIFDLSTMAWNEEPLPRKAELAVGLCIDSIFDRLLEPLYQCREIA